MRVAAGAGPAAADSASPLHRVSDRLLVQLSAIAALTAVGAYLAVHRRLITEPGGELLAALAGGAWQPRPDLHLSFGLLLLPPVGMALALACSLWPWSRGYDRSPTLRLLATLVATSAAVVVLQAALGAAGILRTATLAVAGGGLAALLLVAARARRAARPAGAASSAGGRRLAAGPLAGLAGRLGLAPPSGLGLVLGGLVALAWLALAAVGALVPPWGWDSLVYHLTDIFWFARAGGLEAFPHPAEQFHFPKVAELHGLWFYLLAGGGDGAWRVTGIALLPLSLTAGVAVRAAGELLGLRAALPWLAPAVMLVPLALIQPLAGYADLAMTAFLLAGFAFLLAALRRGRPSDWALAALSCGLALGSKLSFLYLALPLMLLLVRRPARLLPRLRTLLRLPLYALLFAAGCGFWLLPNLLRTGNPFHPVAVTVAGRTLLDGPVALEIGDSNRDRYTASAAGWLLYPFRERVRGQVAYSPDNGFGPQFAAAWLAVPLALALAIRRRRWLLARALLAAPATAIAWLAVSPWEHPRYALTACGLALLALAAIEEAAAAGPGASRAARALLRSAVVLALLFAAPAGLLAAAPELPRVAARWQAGDWQASDYYPRIYGPAGSAFNWLAEHGGEGTTVSFDRPTFVAPLFGWHGRNRVVFAASPGELGVDGLAVVGSSRGWRRFLTRERVDYLVLWREWWDARPEPSPQARWLAADPEGFAEVARFGEVATILTPSRPAGGLREPPVRPLAGLASPDRWRIEYVTGASAELAADPAGGLRIDYQFLTRRPDYVDLRLELIEGDWPPDGRLVFGLDGAGGSPLLWLYLKEADPRRSCRYRIAPRPADATPAEVVVELGRPERRTAGFNLGRAASVHLVLDDGAATRASRGSLRLHDFRLERPAEAPPHRPPAKEG